MIVAMIDANHISERLASLRLEMSDLRVANARYWSRKEHTALDKSASALRLNQAGRRRALSQQSTKSCGYRYTRRNTLWAHPCTRRVPQFGDLANSEI
jgi:hypothetical protein